MTADEIKDNNEALVVLIGKRKIENAEQRAEHEAVVSALLDARKAEDAENDQRGLNIIAAGKKLDAELEAVKSALVEDKPKPRAKAK